MNTYPSIYETWKFKINLERIILMPYFCTNVRRYKGNNRRAKNWLE